MPVQEKTETATTIIAMERAALDRWGRGDPDGFLEISDADVTYFDPFTENKVNGREMLAKIYDGIRGKIQIERYEMIDPRVEVFDNVALLTFNFVSYGNEGAMRWNTTEVYRHQRGEWRIVHTHWSLAQAASAAAEINTLSS